MITSCAYHMKHYSLTFRIIIHLHIILSASLGSLVTDADDAGGRTYSNSVAIQIKAKY